MFFPLFARILLFFVLKGGFAKCYLGTSMQSKNQYALKIVSKGTLLKPRAKQKLQTEIKIHRTLNHNHIVRFERFFEDNHNAYMLLELCANNSMSDLMKRRKKLCEFEARFYLIQIVESLKYLHSHGVIHRDLKLGNLFIDHHMIVKVGDFGLATRLTHPDERKKTVCGTPNYIAPEILEGKDGHSFEVDIWSTGVILYTLLVGKPPFESKDVKSTYKRIIANQYSFPDHTPVCEHAKNLIRYMLQPRPEKRPSLEATLEHSFFSRPTAYTPTSLPESSLREEPAGPTPSEMQQYTSAASKKWGSDYGVMPGNTANASNKLFANQPSYPPVNDENDPNFTNRIAVPAGDKPISEKPMFSMEKDLGRMPAARPMSALSERANFAQPSGAPATGVQRPRTAGPTRPDDRDKDRKGILGSARVAYESTLPQPMSTGRSPLATTMGISGDRVAAAPRAALRMPTQNSAVEEKGGYVQRFDIYQDSKQSTMAQSTKPVPPPALSRTGSGMTSQEAPSLRTSPRAADEYDDDADAMDVEHIGMHLDGVHLGVGKRQKTPQVAWAAEAGPSEAVAMPVSDVARTPVTQPPKADALKPLDTLETMHKMLNRSFADDAVGSPNASLGDAEVGTPVADDAWPRSTPAAVSKLIARVWVVRYVDYTSKYGLGFLLNTGSAGVYFNDSTKIVLSSDGSIFQYIERRRKEGQANSEHVAQTHLMSAYPVELQKKVTLLRHFRNYLVDQQKLYGQGSRTGESTLESVSSLPMSLPDGASSGADPTIRFGVSSAHFNPIDAVEMGLSSPMNIQQLQSQSRETDMPFLKKWVRTRHAILFRLSNRIVQVVFFDRSEVLLSSEARVVTYVNKQGTREDHSLEDVLHAGRTDIAKRLKYTKDIMYRLISVAK